MSYYVCGSANGVGFLLLLVPGRPSDKSSVQHRRVAQAHFPEVLYPEEDGHSTLQCFFAPWRCSFKATSKASAPFESRPIASFVAMPFATSSFLLLVVSSSNDLVTSSDALVTSFSLVGCPIAKMPTIPCWKHSGHSAKQLLYNTLHFSNQCTHVTCSNYSTPRMLNFQLLVSHEDEVLSLSVMSVSHNFSPCSPSLYLAIGALYLTYTLNCIFYVYI